MRRGGEREERQKRWWRPNLTDGKNKDRPPPPPCCHLFRIKLSAKRSQASWSQKETPRFYPERVGAAPIRVARLVTDGHAPRLEHAGDSGRLGALSFVHLRPWRTNTEESVLVREVAVIRRFPDAGAGSGAGLALTSNVRRLGVRLHDKLFVLPCPAATVTFTFSERWFYVSSKWTEERLHARAGLDYIDITSILENLIGTLYQMYEQEEQDKKMARELEERERRRQEELEARPLASIPLGWGSDLCWESPDQAMHRRFELLLDADGQVRCDCVEQEGLRDMRRRLACDGRFVLPLTTSSSSPLEAVGFVEGYSDSDPEITVAVTEQGVPVTETKTRRPVAMVSRGVHVLTFRFLADRLAIRLDDGVVLTGWNGISVDIVHCGSDDVFWSNSSTGNWTDQILEWRVDDDSPIPCTCLLVQLSRKLWKLKESVRFREGSWDSMPCLQWKQRR